MELIIRQEVNSDQDKVYEVVKQAFQNAEHSEHNEHNLVNRLRKSEAFIPELSLVAEYKKELIGYILFTKVKIGEYTILALAPVAVLPQMQGQGVGKALIIKGHQLAKALGYKGCIVLGHETYYPKFGYQKAKAYKIIAPFELPEECFMAIELEKNGLSGIEGVVEYASAFFEM